MVKQVKMGACVCRLTYKIDHLKKFFCKSTSKVVRQIGKLVKMKNNFSKHSVVDELMKDCMYNENIFFCRSEKV